jgi:hypothetical protein
MLECQPIKYIDKRIANRPMTTAKPFSPFLANHTDDHFGASCLTVSDDLHGLAKNIRIEGPAQSTVTCDHGHLDGPDRTLLEQRVGISIHASTQIGDHTAHPHSIGTICENALLSTPELRRRHHFHGFGDLLRIFDRADFTAKAL